MSHAKAARSFEIQAESPVHLFAPPFRPHAKATHLGREMPDALVVVESPAKAKTIHKFLGKGYRVLACMGHVRDLPDKELGIDIEAGFRPRYQTIRGKGKILSQLRSTAKSASKVYLATDPDREGEAIAWHVANAIGKETRDIGRVQFHEITERAVVEAFEQSAEIDLRKVNAQQARRILDRLVGYQVSPVLWKTVRSGLSAGRVQSVALRLICEREEEIKAFVREEYWTVDAKLQGKEEDAFKASLIRIKGAKLKVNNGEEAARIVGELKARCRGDGCRITKVTKRTQRRHPAPPFITSTLQQEASRRLRFTARKTMRIAQQLYEGVDLDGESTGLITYMRTDSTRMAPEAVAAARTTIREQFGADYVPDRPKVYRSKRGAQDAHEAIRPTALNHTPKSIKVYLTSDQARLYQLIWDRFIACQMKPAVYDQTRIDIAAGDFELRANGSVLEFAGFTVLYVEGRDEGEEQVETRFPASLKDGEVLKLLDVLKEQHFTKPPPRYSEATLVKELESQAIGRPSTYAQITSTIQDRGYVERDRGRFIPTELGTTVNRILVRAFPDLFNVAFTARMEDNLDRVEQGGTEWVDVVKDFYWPFSKDLGRVERQRAELKRSLQEETGDHCEKCGAKMVIKWGRNGKFVACSAFPKCRNTRPLDEEQALTSTGEKCQKCGSDMVVRSGRHGRFLACVGYPGCKNTRPLTLGISCPRQGCEGALVERVSKRRKIFYGCSTFPRCDFMTWHRPLGQECPVCEGPYLAERSRRNPNPNPTLVCLKCGRSAPQEAVSEDVTP